MVASDAIVFGAKPSLKCSLALKVVSPRGTAGRDSPRQ